jgi:hypothetical protein
VGLADVSAARRRAVLTSTGWVGTNGVLARRRRSPEARAAPAAKAPRAGRADVEEDVEDDVEDDGAALVGAAFFVARSARLARVPTDFLAAFFAGFPAVFFAVFFAVLVASFVAAARRVAAFLAGVDAALCSGAGTWSFGSAVTAGSCRRRGRGLRRYRLRRR